jgi:tetratricopeptide (TPR) repeat protein
VEKRLLDMSKTIVFVGNCQLGGLANLYRKFVAADREDIVHYFPSYQQSTDDQRRIIAGAQIVLQQTLDFAPQIGEFQTEAKIYLIPHLAGSFIWPCGGQAHPRNMAPVFGDPAGPYNAELGDSFLNKMIAENVDPDEALDRYLNTNLAATRRVERMRELVLEQQRARDLMCGYNFADYIDSNFRNKKLFRTQNHPDDALGLVYVTSVFENIGVDVSILDQMRRAPRLDMFPRTEAPIHPSIISYFGMTCVTTDTRYRYFDEGGITFTEFVGRYMRYQFNVFLEEGYYLARTGQRDTAIDVLRKAIEESPRTASGRSVLAGLLAQKGNTAEAALLAEQAFKLEPSNDHLGRQVLRLQSELMQKQGVQAETS